MEELKTLFTNIANAIRTTGVTEGEMTLADMPDLIASIVSSSDISLKDIEDTYNTVCGIGSPLPPYENLEQLIDSIVAAVYHYAENEALQGHSIAELYNTAAKDISAIGTTIDPSSCDTVNDVFTKIWDDGYGYGCDYWTDIIWRNITDYAISQGYPLREDFKFGGKYYKNFEEFIGWLMVEAEWRGNEVGSNG